MKYLCTMLFVYSLIIFPLSNSIKENVCFLKRFQIKLSLSCWRHLLAHFTLNSSILFINSTLQLLAFLHSGLYCHCSLYLNTLPAPFPSCLHHIYLPSSKSNIILVNNWLVTHHIRYCFKCIKYIYLLNPHNNTMKQVLLLSLF